MFRRVSNQDFDLSALRAMLDLVQPTARVQVGRVRLAKHAKKFPMHGPTLERIRRTMTTKYRRCKLNREGSEASARRAIARRRGTPSSSVFEKHGVRVGVRRRTAAQQHQRLVLAGPQLVNNAGRNDNAIACSHWALVVT